jgi:ubiquinone biosynthesis protein Coq4
MEALRAAPAGSLGAELCRMIVENGYDLEVLDRDALELSKLRPPLDYLNARILQTHDLWHIVAGYRLTKLHEIALSAFQLAQFGHNYSAMFLAVVVASAAFHTPAAVPLLLETILSAWAHGRETPPLMAIAWEREWHLSADAIRAAHGISEYASPFPADLIEMFEATAQAA